MVERPRRRSSRSPRRASIALARSGYVSSCSPTVHATHRRWWSCTALFGLSPTRAWARTIPRKEAPSSKVGRALEVHRESFDGLRGSRCGKASTRSECVNAVSRVSSQVCSAFQSLEFGRDLRLGTNGTRLPGMPRIVGELLDGQDGAISGCLARWLPGRPASARSSSRASGTPPLPPTVRVGRSPANTTPTSALRPGRYVSH
jgi:hypothetical protein